MLKNEIRVWCFVLNSQKRRLVRKLCICEAASEFEARSQLHGACADCSMINMTMKGGVESAIKNVAPEVTAIEAINL